MTNLVLQNFIRNGYVILKPDYPDELHQTIHRKTQLAFKNGNPGNKILEHVPELHKIFDHVEVSTETESNYYAPAPVLSYQSAEQ